MGTTREPGTAARMLFAASSQRSSDQPATTTRTPAAASLAATARPSPEAAPVTIAVASGTSSHGGGVVGGGRSLPRRRMRTRRAAWDGQRGRMLRDAHRLQSHTARRSPHDERDLEQPIWPSELSVYPSMLSRPVARACHATRAFAAGVRAAGRTRLSMTTCRNQPNMTYRFHGPHI